jgi:hypothetical protein
VIREIGRKCSVRAQKVSVSDTLCIFVEILGNSESLPNFHMELHIFTIVKYKSFKISEIERNCEDSKSGYLYRS